MMRTSKYFFRDIIAARPLSWSAKSSFDYDKEQWWEKYILHRDCTRNPAFCAIAHAPDPKCPQIATNAAMRFGKMIGEKLASDPTFLPKVPRLSVFEFPLGAVDKGCKPILFGKIPLIGFIDGYEPHTDLDEYKTGKRAWDQKRVDEHGQLTFYALMLHLAHKVVPEDLKMRLVYLPTEMRGDFSMALKDVDPVIFETNRTMKDIILFGKELNETYAAMEAYAKNHA